jgi:hypothetical protein
MTLPIDPTAPIVQGLGWLQELEQRHHDAKVNYAANVVFHAGVVVLTLRSLNDRMKALFEPLIYFNPLDWPAERRDRLREEIRAFASGTHTFDVLVEHQKLLSQLTLKRPAGADQLRITVGSLASDVAHMAQSRQSNEADRVDLEAELEARETKVRWYEGGPGGGGPYVAIARDEEGWEVPLDGPDLAIRFQLPVLLFLIRHADVGQPDQIKALRNRAALLIRIRSEIDATPLAKVVNQANAAFGELTGLLMTEHRALTYPDWTRA